MSKTCILKSVLKNKDIYPADSVGGVYGEVLLSVCDNDEEGEIRYSRLIEGLQIAKSQRFRRLVEDKNSSYRTLQAICNSAYLMKAMGEDAGRVPDNVNESETKEYWDDVRNFCSIGIKFPDNWNTRI